MLQLVMITVLFARPATRSGFLAWLIFVGRPRDYFDVGDQDLNSVTKIEKFYLLVWVLNFGRRKNRTSCIFREQDCTYEYIIIYFSRYASRQHWAVYMNSTPSDEVTWENSTWNEHQLGLIHIIRILANHNRRNSSKFNEILRSKPILLCVILPRLGIVISGLILALSRICLMQR